MRLVVTAILILALFNLPSWATSRGAHEGGESSSESHASAGYSSASHASVGATLETEEVVIPARRTGGGCSQDGSYMPVLSGHRPVVSRHNCSDEDSEAGRARCER